MKTKKPLKSKFTLLSLWKLFNPKLLLTLYRYEIEAMPTFLFFKNSEQIDKMTGASEAKIREIIDKNYSA
jgi:hypothetical protein